MLAIAAIVTLLAGITVYSLFTAGQKLTDGLVSVDEFRESRANFAVDEFDLDLVTGDLAVAKAFLDEQGYPTYLAPPITLTDFNGTGCKTIDWEGHKISLICFVNADRHLVYLFIIGREALSDLESLSTLPGSIVIHHGRQTGGWLGSDHLFLLVSSLPGVKIPTIKD